MEIDELLLASCELDSMNVDEDEPDMEIDEPCLVFGEIDEPILASPSATKQDSHQSLDTHQGCLSESRNGHAVILVLVAVHHLQSQGGVTGLADCASH